jgi:beta-lactamase regulating signal transducer with metallopeptidase domain
MIAIWNLMAYRWWDWMGSMFWQASLLILVVSGLDLLIRRWVWPQVRYVLWLLVFVKLLIPPGWHLPTAVVPRLFGESQELLGRIWDRQFPQPAALQAAESASPESAAMPQPLTGPGGSDRVATAASAQLLPQAYLFGFWLAGMALFLFLLIFKMFKLRRWHRQQEERKTIPPWFHELLIEISRRLNLERLPAIVFSRDAVTPAVYGVFRPVLLLPEHYLNDLSREEAEHVLLHELCHVKRGDLWVHGLVLLLQIAYWFNPFLLWAIRQLSHVREMCCDQTLAARLQGRTEAYRKTLLNTARELLTEKVEPGMGLLGVFEEPFWLVARIRWLEKKTWHHRKSIAAAAALVILSMAILVMPMAGRPAAVNLPADPAAQYLGSPSPANQQLAEAPVPAAGIRAVYCRMITRETDYFLWFEAESRFFAMDEGWHSADKLALIEGGRTFILDKEKNRFLFLNRNRKTYLDVPLPVNRTTAYSPELARFFEERKTSGRVEPLNETQQILGRTCKGFRLINWSVYGNEQSDRAENVVWTTNDVPFRVAMFDEALVNMRLLVSNMDESLQQEMQQRMKGYQMGIEQETGRFPWKKRYVMRVVEMAEKIAPPGIFSVPPDYVRLEQLDVANLR